MELIDRKALIDELPSNSMDTMTAYQIGLMILRQPTIADRPAEHPTCETCVVYHKYKKGCPLEWSSWNPKVDYCSNHKYM